MLEQLEDTLEDGDQRFELHEEIDAQVNWLRLLDGITAPDLISLIERVRQYDQRLALDVDAAIGALKAEYGIAGYMVGWRRCLDACDDDGNTKAHSPHAVP